MKTIIAVKLCDCDTDNPEYLARSESECKDSVDAMVFRLVHEMHDIITVGKTVGTPIWGEAGERRRTPCEAIREMCNRLGYLFGRTDGTFNPPALKEIYEIGIDALKHAKQ